MRCSNKYELDVLNQFNFKKKKIANILYTVGYPINLITTFFNR